MSTIKQITEVAIVEEVEESAEPTIYVENEGTFRRARGRQARKVIGLDGIVVTDGLLCVELDE
jgi:hypothetical protein